MINSKGPKAVSHSFIGRPVPEHRLSRRLWHLQHALQPRESMKALEQGSGVMMKLQRLRSRRRKSTLLVTSAIDLLGICRPCGRESVWGCRCNHSSKSVILMTYGRDNKSSRICRLSGCKLLRGLEVSGLRVFACCGKEHATLPLSYLLHISWESSVCRGEEGQHPLCICLLSLL